ncbi:hypothetical protein OIV83_003886 [Microbotryomycetes sp. JL201]|nr:hypothetical protein OIV83_003886 [Microbotryomycetes sp. JL201]
MPTALTARNGKLQPQQQQQDTQQNDPYTEYATFLHDAFDPNEFVHSIVNNEPYPRPQPSGSSSNNTTTLNGASTHALAAVAIDQDGPGHNPNRTTAPSFLKGLSTGGSDGGPVDVSQALAKLNFGVEDLNRQLKQEITRHHSSLLLQAASLGGLESDLAEVRDKLAQVEGGVTNLRKKITVPYQSLESSLTLLARLRRASLLGRRASRFFVLARRLQGQMADIEGVIHSKTTTDTPTKGSNIRDRKDRAMAEAALTLAELDILLSEVEPTTEDGQLSDSESAQSIKALDVVAAHVPTIELSRRRVVEEMESEVQRGLDELNNSLLASSLQTAHNLSVLPALVEALVNSLTDLVTRKVKAVFDMASIAREVGHKEPTNAAAAFVYKSRTRNEPTTATMPAWTNVLWGRLEAVMTELSSICIKTYTLERVLKLKRDQSTQQTFLDEAMAVLENKPSSLFWTSLSHSFETVAKEAVKGSPFVQSTFSTGYTRLLRLFQEFFSRIAVHSDTVYTQLQQSPETVVVLRAIQPFEALYLTRSTNRLNEAVTSSFSISSSLSASFTSRPPTVPTANEGLGLSRAVVNELDAARFDPLLVRSVAVGAGKAIDAFVARSEALVAQDHSATSLVGPVATPSQHSNADLTSSLYHVWSPLNRSMNDHAEANVRKLYMAIATPLILAIRRDFASIISRMHRVDYSKPASEGHGTSTTGGPSSYMADLTNKLAFVRDELLGTYKIGELGREWALDLARFTVQTFILHASIVKHLSEAGKLKLTSDVTSLEFAVSQYLSPFGLSLATMGDQFKTLKAFRPLLFLDDAELSKSPLTSDVPSLVLMHHILSRSRLVKLPHQLKGWTETEYVRWLNEHGEQERIALIEQVIQEWDDAQGEWAAGDVEDGGEVAATARMIEFLKELVRKSKNAL